MKFKVKILETDTQVQKMVLDALLPYCDEFLQKVFIEVKKELPLILSQYITSRPEYMSLVSGSLRLELGIPDPQNKIMELLNYWINNIDINFSKAKIINNQIKANFSIGLVSSDFSDVLGSDAAFVHDNLRGYSLPWLEWLLLDGNKTLVPKQQVIIGSNNRSRTGMAIMKQDTKGWKVPSEFSGTIRDNWITRSIDDASNDINNLLERVLQ